MLVLAIFGVVINQSIFIYGAEQDHPINSSIIMISNPVVVFIITLVLLIWKGSTGGAGKRIVLAIIGRGHQSFLRVEILSNGQRTHAGEHQMTLVNSISWAVFIVLPYPSGPKYNTSTSMSWIFLIREFFSCFHWVTNERAGN